MGFPQVLPNRVSSFFGDELILGSYLTRLLPFFLIFFIFNYKNKKILELIFLFSLLFTVILSGERTATFLLFLSFFYFFFFFLKNSEKLFIYPLYFS